MTKRQDLYLQRRSRSEQSDQRQPNQAKNISHQPRASPNSTPLTSRIEFPTMTGCMKPILACSRLLPPWSALRTQVRHRATSAKSSDAMGATSSASGISQSHLLITGGNTGHILTGGE